MGGGGGGGLGFPLVLCVESRIPQVLLLQMSEENYSSGDPGDPSKGAVIFRQRCATCHTYTQVSMYVRMYGVCVHRCICMYCLVAG